ncbi:hypothetical protein L916_21558 [Phytophthora nicotianae]|uniref:Uncharacterized protein n=1 Tax=Phytophthora nicotianae TaxID=4792 RepID=W2HRG3_PHYNI|nr:hypothetical protein L916_21558 [Phytophthora nicotianae]
MFDKLISVFPVSCERHLSHNARIVALPNFENGVTKILCGPESDLTPSERAAVRPLMRSNEVINTEPSDEELMFAEAAPATLIFQPDHRQSMHPETLEQLLFLRQNRALWSAVTVAAILNHPRTPEKANVPRSGFTGHVILLLRSSSVGKYAS